MTTRNSTSAQLRGKQLKKKLTRMTIGMNVISVLMIILLTIIGKL